MPRRSAATDRARSSSAPSPRSSSNIAVLATRRGTSAATRKAPCNMPRRPSMSVVDDPTTFGRARFSFANEAEIDEFVETLNRFERGDLTPDKWRAFRLVRGTYGQRQADDAQML